MGPILDETSGLDPEGGNPITSIASTAYAPTGEVAATTFHGENLDLRNTMYYDIRGMFLKSEYKSLSGPPLSTVDGIYSQKLDYFGQNENLAVSPLPLFNGTLTQTEDRYHDGETINHLYQYDLSYQLTRAETDRSGTSDITLEYFYDKDGNRIREERTNMVRPDSGPSDRTLTHTIAEGTNKLTGVSGSSYNISGIYYVLAGNRTSLTKNLETKEYGIKQNLHYIDYPNNLTSQLGTLPFHITQNLVSGEPMADDETSLIQDLAYDHNGARMKRVDQLHIYGKGLSTHEILSKLDGSVMPQTTQPLLASLPAFNLATLPLLLAKSDTDAYGLQRREDSGNLAEEGQKEPHLFTGQEKEPDLGLYYYGDRWYTPEIGRFLQVDPPREFFNPYSYVGNNPINAWDPSGMVLKGSDLSDEEQIIISAEFSMIAGYQMGYRTGDDGVSKPIGLYFDEAGNLQVVENAVIKEGSETARDSLSAFISDETVVTMITPANTTYTKYYAFAAAISDNSNIDPAGRHLGLMIDFEDFSDGLMSSNDVPGEAYGIGITLFHELHHNFTGEVDPKSWGDATATGSITGTQVKFANRIRTELGLPTRMSYMAFPALGGGSKLGFSDAKNPKVKIGTVHIQVNEANSKGRLE